MEIGNVAMPSQKTLGDVSALSRTETKNNEQMRNSGSEEEQVMTKESFGGVKEDYTAVSRDGDTLSLSENHKFEEMSPKETKTIDGKVTTGVAKMTDAELAKCSSQKLKQLLQQGKISKQQYEKAMKKK